jgi:hypothetical protein
MHCGGFFLFSCRHVVRNSPVHVSIINDPHHSPVLISARYLLSFPKDQRKKANDKVIQTLPTYKGGDV